MYWFVEEVTSAAAIKQNLKEVSDLFHAKKGWGYKPVKLKNEVVEMDALK